MSPRGVVRAPADVTAQIEALRAAAELAAGVPVSWNSVAVAMLRRGLAAIAGATSQG